MKDVLFSVVPPFSTDTEGIVGDHPFEVGIDVSFHQAFTSLQWKIVTPRWAVQSGRLVSNFGEWKSILEGLCKQSDRVIFLCHNNYPSVNDSFAKFTLELVKSVSQNNLNFRSLVFIGDLTLYRGEGLKFMLSESLAVFDLVIHCNPSTTFIASALGIQNFAKQFFFIRSLPVCSRMRRQKSVDVSLIGSKNKNIRARLFSRLIVAFDRKFHMATYGRDSKFPTDLSTHYAYLEALARSKITITSPYSLPYRIGEIEGNELYTPALLPGRIAEALSCYTLPLHISNNAYHSSYPALSKYIPYFHISEDQIDNFDYLKESLLEIEDYLNTEEFSRQVDLYIEQYLCARSIFPDSFFDMLFSKM
jgi:hypothetical protein